MPTLSLLENIYGLCLQYLDITKHSWLLNLPRLEVQDVLFCQWKCAIDFKVVWESDTAMMYIRDVLSCTEYPEQKTFILNGRPGRIDGPSIISRIGNKYTTIWMLYGNIHREDGPALINACGEISWFRHGLCHREDGPAIIRSNGDQEWWINGKRIR